MNVNGRTLDLAFANAPDYIELIDPPVPLLKIDPHHKPFLLRLDTHYTTRNHASAQMGVTYLDFRRCDVNLVNNELSAVDWLSLLNRPSIDETVSVFYDKLHRIFDKVVPRRHCTSNAVNRKPWWTGELRQQRNRLRKARNRFFSVRSDENKNNLRNIESSYNELLASTYEAYVNNLQSNLKQNPASFWKFVRDSKANKRIPCNVEYEGVTAATPSESATLFADFLKSVFSTSPPIPLPGSFQRVPSYDVNLPTVCISPEEVLKLLNDLDVSKGAGVDGLPPSIIKACALKLVTPVTLIFNQSLSKGEFPTMWKTAKMVPIHKTGNLNRVENYRGISILCCLGKVFEKLVHQFLYNASRPLICEFQHGFVERRSTTTNLMCYTNTLFHEVEARSQVDSVYVDFSKAFDTVPHIHITEKLLHMGFPIWIIEWLKSYLTNRKAFVQIETEESSVFDVTSGVPQGSVLGPLIFILYINDLGLRLSSGKSFFADDFKLFRVIASVLDCAAIQNDIDELLKWCEENGMNVNIKKCKAISFTRCRTVLKYSYKIGPSTLERVDSIRDLGVILDSKLRFNEQISTTAAKAFAILGYIRRHAAFITDAYALKALFCSLVRSILEYAAPVWTPYQSTLASKLERVQKYFVRFALRHLPWNNETHLPPYTSRCLLLDLETLSARRLKLQRIFIFDILTDRIDCPALRQLVNFNAPSRSLRTHAALYVPHHRTSYGHNNPLSTCIRAFNTVYDQFDFNISKNVFSTRIRNLD